MNSLRARSSTPTVIPVGSNTHSIYYNVVSSSPSTLCTGPEDQRPATAQPSTTADGFGASAASTTIHSHHQNLALVQ